MDHCWDNKIKSDSLKHGNTQEISLESGLKINNDLYCLPIDSTAINTSQQIAEQNQQNEVDNNLVPGEHESKTAFLDRGPSKSHPKMEVLSVDKDLPAKAKTTETTKQSNFPFFTNPCVPIMIENEESLVHKDYITMVSGKDPVEIQNVHGVSSFDVTCSSTELKHLSRESLNYVDNTLVSKPTLKNADEGGKSCDAILHQIQQQQKGKAGRPFKKKTLRKMAKLIAIAQELDTEGKERSKKNIMRPLQKDLSESVSDVRTSDQMNVTLHSTEGKSLSGHEKEISTSKDKKAISVYEKAVPKTVMEQNRNKKRKKKSRKKKDGIYKIEKDTFKSKLSIDLVSSTNIQDVCVSRPVALSAEELLELAAGKQQQTTPLNCDKEIKMDIAMCTTTASTNFKDPPGVREVLELKRKAGRPHKKNTLIKLAKRLSVTQEQDSGYIPQCTNMDRVAPLSPSDVLSISPLKSDNSPGVTLTTSPQTKSEEITVNKKKTMRRKKKAIFKNIPDKLCNISTPTLRIIPGQKLQEPCKREESHSKESGLLNHSTPLQAPVLTLHDSEEVAAHQTTISSLTTSRTKCKKDRNPLNLLISKEMSNTSISGIQMDLVGQAKELVLVSKDPHIPGIPVKQQQTKCFERTINLSIPSETRKSNLEIPLDQRMELDKPNVLSNKVQIQSDELCASPTKLSKVKICRKKKSSVNDLIKNAKRHTSLALLPLREKELDVPKTCSHGEQALGVSFITSNVLTTDHESYKVIETKNKCKGKANSFTSDHEAVVPLDGPFDRSALVYKGPQEIKSEPDSISISSKTVSKIVKKRSKASEHNTESHNVSPSVPPNVVPKYFTESDIFRTQYRSKPFLDEGKTGDCKNITEKKAPLDCLSAFVQDMFCDNTAIEKTKLSEENGDEGKTDSSKQKLKCDVGVDVMDSDLTTLISSKVFCSESQATLLQISQTTEGFQKTDKGLEGEPTRVGLVGEHKCVDAIADNSNLEPLTSPKVEIVIKRSKNKRQFKTEKLNCDTQCTNFKDSNSASIEKSLENNHVQRYRGRRKGKALKEELAVIALLKDRKELPSIVPKDSNIITNVQTENPQNNPEVKGKNKRKTVNSKPKFAKSNRSSSKIDVVVSNVKDPLTVSVGNDLTINLQIDGKNKCTAAETTKVCPFVEQNKKRSLNLKGSLKASTTKTSQDLNPLGKGKRKCKKKSQRVNVVTSPDKIPTLTSKEGLEKEIETGKNKKCRTAKGNLPIPVTVYNEKVSTCKLQKAPQNQVVCLRGGTHKYLRGKTRHNRFKTVLDVETEPTLNEKAMEKEDKVHIFTVESIDVLRCASEPPPTNMKKPRKTKCKSIKESVNTAVVQVTELSPIDAKKSKRQTDNSLKKKSLKITNRLSGELQEENTKTSIQINRKHKIKTEVTSNAGEGNEMISSSTPLRRGVVRSCNSVKTKSIVFNNNVSHSAKTETTVYSDYVANSKDMFFKGNNSVDTNQISSEVNEALSGFDLNIIKQESLEINAKDFNITSETPRITRAVTPVGEENLPVESVSIFSFSEQSAKMTNVSKNRRKKTIGKSKNKSKPPRYNLINSEPVNGAPHCSDDLGLSFSSSSSHSLLDNEIISLKLKEEIEHANCNHPLVDKEKTNVDNKNSFLMEKSMTYGAPLEGIQYEHGSKESVCKINVKSRKPIFCYFCGRSFRHISAYTIHKRIHTGEKPYRCLECGKRFAQLSKLYLHSNIHKEPQVMKCPCCVGRFSSKDRLITHLKVHIRGNIDSTSNNSNVKEESILNKKMAPKIVMPAYPTDFKGLNCTTCNKRFFTKATLNMHLQTQCGVKAYMCNVCGKRFGKSSRLKVHEKSHWPVKPYACSVCGKGFAKLQKLRSHSQMHSGVLPFFCNNCDHAFNSFSLLRTHQMLKVCHEKNKDDGNKDGVEGFFVTQGVEGKICTPMYFKCQICKQLYSHWCHYILHLPMHTKSSPYLCEICGQHYDQSPQTLIHCKVCCKSSGEQRACNSCLPEILREPETAPLLTPKIHVESLSIDDHEVAPPNEQVYRSLDLIYSPHLETMEEELVHMPSKCPSPDVQSLSFDRNYSPDSVGAGAIPTSPTFFRGISEQPDPQPSGIHSCSTFQRQHARYSCRKCGKSFYQWRRLWLHEGVHNKKGQRFSCSECHSAFRFFGSYMNHMKEHACHRPYACPLCPETFVTEENQRSHIWEHHKPQKKMNCGICGKNFSSLTNLKRHRLLHTGAPSHFCFTCNMSFSCGAGLKNHLKDHKMRPQVPVPKGTLEPLLFPYNCKNCEAKFTRTDLLEAHQVCHFVAGRKPTSMQAKNVSTFPNLRFSKAHQRLGIFEFPRQIPSLPVTKRKHLFRYPNPDRLYVVPMVSSDPPIMISDTDDNPDNIILMGQSTPQHDMNTNLNKGCLKPTTSTLPQLPLPFSPVTFGEPEQNTSQVYQSSLCLFDEESLHNVGGQCQNKSTDNESLSDGVDNNVMLLPATWTKQPDMEFGNYSLKCAVCMTTFFDVFKLHEHYINHARGL